MNILVESVESFRSICRIRSTGGAQLTIMKISPKYVERFWIT